MQTESVRSVRQAAHLLQMRRVTRPRAHRPLRSLVCCVDNGTGPAHQLKSQPLAFDDSSREAAAASGLAIVKSFFEDRNMERPTCACCNELKAPSRTRPVSIEEGGSWLARIRTRLTWEHTTSACSAEVTNSTTPAHHVCLLRPTKVPLLYSSEAPLLAGIPLAPSGVAINEQGSRGLGFKAHRRWNVPFRWPPFLLAAAECAPTPAPLPEHLHRHPT